MLNCFNFFSLCINLYRLDWQFYWPIITCVDLCEFLSWSCLICFVLFWWLLIAFFFFFSTILWLNFVSLEVYIDERTYINETYITNINELLFLFGSYLLKSFSSNFFLSCLKVKYVLIFYNRKYVFIVPNNKHTSSWSLINKLLSCSTFHWLSPLEDF